MKIGIHRQLNSIKISFALTWLCGENHQFGRASSFREENGVLLLHGGSEEDDEEHETSGWDVFSLRKRSQSGRDANSHARSLCACAPQSLACYHLYLLWRHAQVLYSLRDFQIESAAKLIISDVLCLLFFLFFLLSGKTGYPPLFSLKSLLKLAA